MRGEIFIIHPSSIVRKGLNAILRSYFNIDVILLNAARELRSYGEIRNSRVIVFAGPEALDDPALIGRLRSRNELRLVLISGAIGKEDVPGGFDDALSLSSTDQEVADLVTGMVDAMKPERDRKSGGEELTAREKDVLSLVAIGLSSKEIADRLFISIHTVISHRKNITEKLGIKSISGLTVYAILNRIIDPDNLDTDLLI